MGDPTFVQVLHSLQYLSSDMHTHVFRHRGFSTGPPAKVTKANVLHDDKQPVVGFVVVDIFHDVGLARY